MRGQKMVDVAEKGRSGHGFSTGRREERRRMRSEFPRWGNERADESHTRAAPERRCGLLSAKGGLMMGTKKVGAFSSPRKKATVIITRKKQK